jgi:hypothetical protein
VKAILIVLVITTGVFSSATYMFYQDSQQKAGVIRVQIADITNKSQVIQNQVEKIGALDLVVTNQTSVIQNQTGRITKLNFTVFDQNDTIQRQIFELRRRADQIDLLEGNVSKLKVDLQKTQNEIVSLTPVTRNYFVAAVKGDGGGAIIPLVIKVLPKGTGLLAVNIKNVELQSGAQESIRLAAAVASKLSNIGLSDKDIDISFVNELADLVSVDGPSAGGAITVAIYATLRQQSLSSSTLMTGTIQADGTIGQVGGVDKKAQAARTQGASRFLVPKGQSVTVSGIEVKEINTIQDAITNVVG